MMNNSQKAIKTVVRILVWRNSQGLDDSLDSRLIRRYMENMIEAKGKDKI